MCSVSVSITSEALVVAASMAVMRAACSAAADFGSRAINLHFDVARQQAC